MYNRRMYDHIDGKSLLEHVNGDGEVYVASVADKVIALSEASGDNGSDFIVHPGQAYVVQSAREVDGNVFFQVNYGQDRIATHALGQNQHLYAIGMYVARIARFESLDGEKRRSTDHKEDDVQC